MSLTPTRSTGDTPTSTNNNTTTNSNNVSTMSFDYDGFQCREFSFSTANAINLDDSDAFFANHKDSMAPTELGRQSGAVENDDSILNISAEVELDDTIMGPTTANTSTTAADTPIASTPTTKLINLESTGVMTPVNDTSDIPDPFLTPVAKPNEQQETQAEEEQQEQPQAVEAVADAQAEADENKENQTPAEPKPRFINLKTSWGPSTASAASKATSKPSKSRRSSGSNSQALKGFKSNAAKPQRKKSVRVKAANFVKKMAGIKARSSGKGQTKAGKNAVKKALAKSKKSKNMAQFVPLRSKKTCTAAREPSASLTRVPEHKTYDGYVSVAENLVKFFTDIPQRFLSGEKSAKKQKPTAPRTHKTTEELQMEQARMEKEKLMAEHKRFLELHPELAMSNGGGFQKRSAYVPTDPCELDPNLPYEEAVAKQAEALRMRAEAERQERNKQMQQGLQRVLESTEGELGICRKEVKQPTEPTTPEFLRRALMNKERKDKQRLTEKQEAELMEKMQRRFKANGVPVFVTKTKPAKRAKRVESTTMEPRKFKSRPFKKPPTPKMERKHKATQPEPFSRATLYQNPKEKKEHLKEQLEREEQEKLKQHREFKARPFTAPKAPSIARPRRKVKPDPFRRDTLYRDPREKVDALAQQLAQEQAPQPFKARGMPVYPEFKVERPQTMVVAEPFELESVRRAQEHRRQLEEQQQQREMEEEAERRKRNKKKPLGELTNNPNFDPQHAVLKKEMSIQRAKEKMAADKLAKEESEQMRQQQLEEERKEYRKMLNKLSFRRDMPIFPSPKSLRSEAPLVEPETPDVARPLNRRHRQPALPAYLRK
ncbi:hypothetical protein PTSG_07667 [Salpingoeca rosetta]|uniref:Uncharacterized protein n=1 Tax=Salpingoeca rosetta (strain ATCC 50818 / BSB-021) TaxID=946362 RepID=F2UHF3_SALR5|nr:uncharacterized protein PTSG_07667 [Salpingoeca rosetta]EGD76552.1 hypothetical protein PTSG_07667 [Salpingoeca rosetta]|eukprot:XP_004991466.1 hypothetical protein PTSG_07667 [Salpingoeca rosetta]